MDHERKTIKGVYLVTDENSCLHHTLETVVSEAARAGTTIVQLREKMPQYCP